jgi:hypothetical protein
MVAIGLVFWLREPPPVDVNFITYPFDATILLDGVPLVDSNGNRLKTPCTADDLPARAHHVAFEHRDFAQPLDAGEIDFAKVRQVEARFGTNGVDLTTENAEDTEKKR